MTLRLLISSAIMALCAHSAAHAGPAIRVSPSTPMLTARSFFAPPLADRPWVRWNITAEATEEELGKELRQIQAAGIAGVEVGQGDSFPSIGQIGFILRTATTLGLKVALFSGPFNTPAGFSIDDDQARKTLVFGEAIVAADAPFSGTLPAPAKVSRKSLVAVLAYRAVGPCAKGAPCTLDVTSRVDLTQLAVPTARGGVGGAVSDGRLAWAPPGEGQWVVLSIWSAGALAQPDLLTRAGTQVLTDSLDRFLAPFAGDLRANGGDFFYDSHSEWRGDPTDSWSNTLAEDFRAKRGYGVEAYLPLLLRLPAVGFKPAAYAFHFDTATSARFRNDIDQVRTELWLDNHIAPVKQWAARYNQHLIVQPYGDNIESIDQIQAAAALDKPETETLWFGDVVDNYLPPASANHMLRRTWYSIEGSAVLGGAYAQSLQDQVVHLNRAYAGGVTKLIYHIYPYKSAPGAHWPGFSTFPNSFGNSWGPRSPEWSDASAYNAYFARSEQVLKQGDAKVDVAVYMQNYLWPQPYTMGGLQYWPDPALSRAGYTRDYLDPTLLDLPNATVSAGRLAKHGPGYKALIIDGTQLPELAASRSSMSLVVARKLLGFARAGLPIVIVGNAPATVPGLDSAADSALRDVMTQLIADPHTHITASEADVPALLARIGVMPSAKPATPGPVLSVHRKTVDTDFYWLFNQEQPVAPGEPATLFAPAQGEVLETAFTLSGPGRPYQLDPWSGAIKPIANWSREGEAVRVQVRLAKGASTVIALTTAPGRFGPAGPAKMATKGLLPVQDLTKQDWQLDVEDWRPAHPFATTGEQATETRRTPLHLTLHGLKPWPAIPELADVSGVGVYSTEWTMPPARGAVLKLGEVSGSFRVSINGRALPVVDQLAREVDVSALLHPGRNWIEVRVATNLNNRLRTLDPALKDRARQPYGLVGPVTIEQRR